MASRYFENIQSEIRDRKKKARGGEEGRGGIATWFFAVCQSIKVDKIIGSGVGN